MRKLLSISAAAEDKNKKKKAKKSKKPKAAACSSSRPAADSGISAGHSHAGYAPPAP